MKKKAKRKPLKPGQYGAQELVSDLGHVLSNLSNEECEILLFNVFNDLVSKKKNPGQQEIKSKLQDKEVMSKYVEQAKQEVVIRKEIRNDAAKNTMKEDFQNTFLLLHNIYNNQIQNSQAAKIRAYCLSALAILVSVSLTAGKFIYDANKLPQNSPPSMPEKREKWTSPSLAQLALPDGRKILWEDACGEITKPNSSIDAPSKPKNALAQPTLIL